MFPKTITRSLILVASLAVLVMLPIPLLPPQSLVGFAQSSLGLGASSAYLLCAMAVQAMIYCALGLAAAFVVIALKLYRADCLRFLRCRWWLQAWR